MWPSSRRDSQGVNTSAMASESSIETTRNITSACRPRGRGIEIDSQVADHPTRSLVTRQVESGVAIRMACLDVLTRAKTQEPRS